MKTRSAAASSSRTRSGSTAKARGSRNLGASRSRTAKSAKTGKAKGQASRSANITTDHAEIQRWAQARNGSPAVVKKTHRGKEAEGILRIDFPGFSGAKTLEHIEWDEWCGIFDKHGLAFLYQERTADGKKSTFNKLVKRSEI
jgi:hypothetical protein